jgi:predicted phosphate transport protein (TIGR00153 family)
VRLSLIPKEHDYFGLFSDLAANLDEAAQLLVRFMEDYGQAKSIGAAILEHEHVGDKILHDIVKRLNRSFITPIDREDIYDLVATMDEVLDNIEQATDAMVLYRVEAPTEYAVRQARVIAEAAAVLHQLINDLEKQTDLMERVISINSLENEGDRIAREAIAALFDDDIDAKEVIKWKDIYEVLESAIDECEHVANVIESIVLKNH